MNHPHCCKQVVTRSVWEGLRTVWLWERCPRKVVHASFDGPGALLDCYNVVNDGVGHVLEVQGIS